nr:hypothetical protein BaRGS_026159 [Batillaria attramentaria]
MWVEDRERAINHFANTFPELAQREEQEDGCNVHLVIADPRQDLKLRAISKSKKAKLVASNEKLEKECSELKAAGGKGAEAGSGPEDKSPETDDQVRHLQAQNAALQKNLTATIEKYEKELSSLRDETERLRGRQSPAGSEDVGKKAEELQAARDRDQKYYQDQISKLQQELEKTRQSQDSIKSASEEHVQGLQRKVNDLQKQVDAASIVGNHQLQEQSAKYQQEIHDLTAQLAALRQKNEDLTVQLQESHRANEETVSQLSAAQQERDSQIQALQEVSRVAEKRKALLDELAIKYQKEYDAHREQVKAAEEKHEAETQALQEEIAKLEELSKAQPLLEELNSKVRSLEDAKGWLERRLKETEARHLLKVRAHKSRQDMAAQTVSIWFVSVIGKATKKSLRKLDANSVPAQASGGKLAIGGWEQLQQSRTELQETTEELKTQHQTELQALSEKHSEELQLKHEEGEKRVKEWEARKTELLEEIESLKNKVSTLKQSIKDGVDERKIHEKKGMTMLKDLKRQLHAEPPSLHGVQVPVAWGKIPQLADPRQSQHADDSKLTLKKVMDLVKSGDHSELHEMNKKLQLMLEETLTKNMHLQQDLEMMSQEVVRLSKLSVQSASAAADAILSR